MNRDDSLKEEINRKEDDDNKKAILNAIMTKYCVKKKETINGD